MKRLEKIRVVQFFLFEQQEILVDETTGIFGPNGSGKSCMLDAMQVAMFGGNTRLSAFNAQADDEQRSTRTLRGYCLGQHGESPEDRVRDHATTYISLIWRDTVTNEPLTMGVCISASADREKHEVLGRYLLPGYELLMSDHLDRSDNQERPRDWASFRHRIQELGRASNDEVLFNDAQRYIEAMLLALRGTGSPPRADSFTRAFRFALRMRFDRSVDQIVRNDVLEPRPTNIKRFREVTDSFKRLAELVASLEAKINDGRKVEADFSKGAEESRRMTTWEAMGRMAAVEVANKAYNQAIQQREDGEEDLGTKQQQMRELGQQIDDAKREELRYREAKEAHAAHKDYGALQTQAQAAEQRKVSRSSTLATELGLLRKVLVEALQSTLLQPMAPAAAPALSRFDDLLANPSGISQNIVANTIAPVLQVAERAYKEVLQQETGIQGRLKDAGRRQRDAKSAMERAKEGRAPLKDDVQRLLSELKDHGLHPVPVCDLVKITDVAWQPVIEAYLGINLQALLVAGFEEAEAYRIYRGMSGPRAVHGAKIARESRQRIGRVPNRGSVAELIDGEHPAAVAYLREMVNELQCVTTDSEALAGKNTLTQDGMLVKGGGFERMRPVSPDRFIIGSGGATQQEAMQQQARLIEKEIDDLNRIQEKLAALKANLELFSNEKLVTKSILESLSIIEEAGREAEAKTLLLQGMADEDYMQLVTQEKIWGGRVSELGGARDELNRSIGKAETRLEDLKKEEGRAQALAVAASETADRARQHPEYDHPYWLSQWDRLIDVFDDNPEDMVAHCLQQAKYAQARMDESVRKGSRGFGEFLQKYKEQTLEDTTTDWRREHAWLKDLLARLEGTDLISHRERMEDAYRTSQETFRNDVAIALSNNLEWLEDTMDRLNRVLRSSKTFSNGERYHFQRVVRPDLKPLLKFIKDVAAYGPTQDLLGGAGEIPETFRALLDEKIAPGSGSQRSPLDDYREFFDFDIEILREDPVSKENKLVGHLSKRLGSGSGGEHRAPLYVIAGAALASAYQLDRGSRDGLRLILLDEAFNKMDMPNIVATMNYLEELGLQVFMASPGENLGTLTAFMHRYYDIMHDPNTHVVDLQGHTVSEEIRTMFRSDLPEFNPGLVAEELAAMRQPEAVVA